MSNQLVSNKYFNRTILLNPTLNTNFKFEKNYLGNFKKYTLSINGEFNVEEENNRLISVFKNENIIGYVYEGNYDKNTKSLTNVPPNNTSNIGYITPQNNTVKLRASNRSGNAPFETWYLKNNNIIESRYSIASNENENNPILWYGTFIPINLN